MEELVAEKVGKRQVGWQPKEKAFFRVTKQVDLVIGGQKTIIDFKQPNQTSFYAR